MGAWIMINFKLLNPMNWFKKEPEEYFNSQFAIIRWTHSAIWNNQLDKYNLEIAFFKNFDDYTKDKPQRIIPYTDEDIKNIREILEIPVTQENLDTDFEFGQETDFGEVVRRI